MNSRAVNAEIGKNLNSSTPHHSERVIQLMSNVKSKLMQTTAVRIENPVWDRSLFFLSCLQRTYRWCSSSPILAALPPYVVLTICPLQDRAMHRIFSQRIPTVQ
jgi:hypothetical protein